MKIAKCAHFQFEWVASNARREIIHNNMKVSNGKVGWHTEEKTKPKSCDARLLRFTPPKIDCHIPKNDRVCVHSLVLHCKRMQIVSKKTQKLDFARWLGLIWWCHCRCFFNATNFCTFNNKHPHVIHHVFWERNTHFQLILFFSMCSFGWTFYSCYLRYVVNLAKHDKHTATDHRLHSSQPFGIERNERKREIERMREKTKIFDIVNEPNKAHYGNGRWKTGRTKINDLFIFLEREKFVICFRTRKNKRSIYLF